MPSIVSVKEELGHHDEGQDLYVMDIQPGEVEGVNEVVHVKVDWEPEETGTGVHIFRAFDGSNKDILRQLPVGLIKRWEDELSAAAEDVGEAGGDDTKSENGSNEESDMSDTKSDAEKDYAGFNFTHTPATDPTLRCLGSFAALNAVAKAQAAQPGEVHQRGGNRFQKQPDGSWKKVGGGESSESGGSGGSAHKPSDAPESIDYHDEDPRRQRRAQHREGQAQVEAQHLDAAEEARHEKLMLDPIEMIKAKAAQAGETRDWGGVKYTKQPDGSWKPVPGKAGKIRGKVDSYGAMVGKKPHQIAVPGIETGMGLRPTHVGFDDKKYGPWLDTLKLHHLRALQDRAKGYIQSAHTKASREGWSQPLQDAHRGVSSDLNHIEDAINRWQDRNPDTGAELDPNR